MAQPDSLSPMASTFQGSESFHEALICAGHRGPKYTARPWCKCGPGEGYQVLWTQLDWGHIWCRNTWLQPRPSLLDCCPGLTEPPFCLPRTRQHWAKIVGVLRAAAPSANRRTQGTSPQFLSREQPLTSACISLTWTGMGLCGQSRPGSPGLRAESQREPVKLKDASAT